MHTYGQAIAFLEKMISGPEGIGMGFHPDTDFADYINRDTGAQLYSSNEAMVLNNLLDNAFLVLGDQIYTEGLRFMQLVGSRW